MQLNEAYDVLAKNENIPKSLTSAVFEIMNRQACGKISEERVAALQERPGLDLDPAKIDE